MPVHRVTGNLLLSSCDALVNTVNCRGPGGPHQASMGKGLALAFARRFPEIIGPYKSACMDGTLRVGVVQVMTAANGKRIVNFPTKNDWRGHSQIPWIRDGLADLARKIADAGIASIAVPPLGCGLGGLSWSQVEPLIIEHLGRIPGLTVEIYPPAPATPIS